MSSKESSEISSPEDDTLRDERQRASEPVDEEHREVQIENFHVCEGQNNSHEFAGGKRKLQSCDDTSSAHKLYEMVLRRQPPLGVVRQLCREAAEKRFQESLSGRSCLLDPLTGMEKQFNVPPA
mmetsp:Transcript_23835/g.53397  ORF Transcript_23835/g.53397 Transcript_23835/m.53397 type:complete len:124 (-) Transcript_23835:200-571(-)|eukprot:760091-Hanusia_phi.AAC.6